MTSLPDHPQAVAGRLEARRNTLSQRGFSVYLTPLRTGQSREGIVRTEGKLLHLGIAPVCR